MLWTMNAIIFSVDWTNEHEKRGKQGLVSIQKFYNNRNIHIRWAINHKPLYSSLSIFCLSQSLDCIIGWQTMFLLSYNRRLKYLISFYSRKNLYFFHISKSLRAIIVGLIQFNIVVKALCWIHETDYEHWTALRK